MPHSSQKAVGRGKSPKGSNERFVDICGEIQSPVEVEVEVAGERAFLVYKSLL
jgi:hypothetical protein